MAPQSTAKPMTEVSMLTILIQAAAAIKNRDGDPSLHGYMDTHGLTSRRELHAKDVDFAVLESIGDILMQKNQILAICPNTGEQECSITILAGVHLKAESDLEIPADDPISEASKISLISATVVPNPNNRHNKEKAQGHSEDDKSNGPLGNIKQVLDGKSMWAQVKENPFYYADR
jgi:hypothetical protein